MNFEPVIEPDDLLELETLARFLDAGFENIFSGILLTALPQVVTAIEMDFDLKAVFPQEELAKQYKKALLLGFQELRDHKVIEVLSSQCWNKHRIKVYPFSK